MVQMIWTLIIQMRPAWSSRAQDRTEELRSNMAVNLHLVTETPDSARVKRWMALLKVCDQDRSQRKLEKGTH
ncbi:hypothetical protein NL676_012067 [Syzygium grande]|nr:hypothetical protein NL676_012067 [Syzygium grande]